MLNWLMRRANGAEIMLAWLPVRRGTDRPQVPRPVAPAQCVSALSDASIRESYPHCASHMR